MSASQNAMSPTYQLVFTCHALTSQETSISSRVFTSGKYKVQELNSTKKNYMAKNKNKY